MPSWSVRVLTIVVAACWARVATAEVRVLVQPPSVSVHDGWANSTALLLALQDGPKGEIHLREWATYVQSTTPTELPPVWVVCHENAQNAALVASLAPQFQQFAVEENASWDTVLKNFALQQAPATVFGILGEGVLPPADFVQSITSVEQALAGSSAPTAVITRSRSNRRLDSAPQWLPDTFIAQIWCNTLAISGLGVLEETVNESTLGDFLPTLVSGATQRTETLALVDGTQLVLSFFDSEENGQRTNRVRASNAVTADGEKLRFGTLELAMLRGENGAASIGTAPWPPEYVLEHVATEEGVVILNSVNCGYLDFAVNFFRTARKVIEDVKILWVATDEVAFDFMDSLAPGCAATFPSPKSERHHAIRAGRYGDQIFKTQTTIRPDILLHIVNQGFIVLWTDSDMVWLENPMPLLPDVHDPEAAELMLQLDNGPKNVCTCFLFMKPTAMVKNLLVDWSHSIIDSGAKQDQIAFQAPLRNAVEAGLILEEIPHDRFPNGGEFFEKPYEDNYPQVHFPNIVVVHNNWIIGHQQKRDRFQEYHLWDVGERVFPSC